MNRKQSEILKQAFSFQDSLTAYAYVVLQDWNLAEDVVQDLFVTVSAKWESFDTSRPLYPWLKRIVRNRAVDIIRSRSKEFYCADEELLDLVEQSFDVKAEQDGKERRSRMSASLKDCISQLNEKSKKLIEGFYSDGKSCAVLSEELKRSENAVYISLTRIRQQLRKCADEKLGLEDAL